MKLCKDCKHFNMGGNTRIACWRNGVTLDPVHGYEIPVKLLLADTERRGTRITKGFREDVRAFITGKYEVPDPSKCGPDAQYFEPKEQP